MNSSSNRKVSPFITDNCLRLILISPTKYWAQSGTGIPRNKITENKEKDNFFI